MIDTNGDGIRALFVTANGSVEGLGEINFTEVAETRPSDLAIPCTTAEGQEGIEHVLVAGRLALQIDKSGDIITGEVLSDRQCFPNDTQADSEITFEEQWIVTGGTGKYLNSYGTINFKGSATILLDHDSGVFVIASSQHTGVIEVNQ